MSLALSELPSNRKYAVVQEGERSLGNCGTLVLVFIRNTGARRFYQGRWAVAPLHPLVVWGPRGHEIEQAIYQQQSTTTTSTCRSFVGSD